MKATYTMEAPWINIVIIIIKRGRQCKAEREIVCTPYQSEDHSLRTERRERKK